MSRYFSGTIVTCLVMALVLCVMTTSAPGQTVDAVKISNTAGGFTGLLDDQDWFGSAVTTIGDLDGNGVPDIVTGAAFDDDSVTDAGAVWVLFLNSDGTVLSHQVITFGMLEPPGPSGFGTEVELIGDLDGDQVNDIIVAAPGDDDGGFNVGAVYILFMNPDGTVKSHRKISGEFLSLPDKSALGSSIAWLGDLDGGGPSVAAVAVGARQYRGAGSGQGGVFIMFLGSDGSVLDWQEISNGVGGLGQVLNGSDSFGYGAAPLGDVDGDGIVDLAVGAPGDSDGGLARGAVWILFLKADGTVKAYTKISATEGGFWPRLDDTDRFGFSLARLQDYDADGIGELAVGAIGDDDGGPGRGAVWILYLGADGTVQCHDKISATVGGFTGDLNDNDGFGFDVGLLGDIDGDGNDELAVGTPLDDDGGVNRGAVWILSLDSLELAVLDGCDIPLSFVEPDLYPGGEIRDDQGLAVSVIMSDGVEADSVLVRHRAGGAQVFVSCRLEGNGAPENEQFFGIVSRDFVTSRGLEYFVEVYKGDDMRSGMVRRVRTRVTDDAFPWTLQRRSYRIMSIPFDMEGTFLGALADDLGGAGPSWRMFELNPETNAYSALPNDSVFAFTQGKAYWLIADAAVNLGTGPAEGLSSPTDQFFEIDLAPGWNMIANPYNFAIAWASVGVDTFTMAEATERMLVSGLYRWIPQQGNAGRYNNPMTEPQEVLEPFDGYLVRASERVVLYVPPLETTPLSPAEMMVTSIQSRDMNLGEWSVEMQARSVGIADIGNYFGVEPGATAGRDRWDWPAPPPIPGRSVAMYFPHDDWSQQSGSYKVDMRGHTFSADENDGDIWHVDVAKNFTEGRAGDDVVLTFIGVDRIPHDVSALLIDKELARTIDLRAVPAYSFYLGEKARVSKQDDARFMLLVGSEAFVSAHKAEQQSLPTRTVLHQNYPNPLNPSTVIRYDLAEPGRVRLRIFNVSGALVRVLGDSDQEPGRYEVGWSGENNRGERVASGVYFYQLTAPGYSTTRKMVLLK